MSGYMSDVERHRQQHEFDLLRQHAAQVVEAIRQLKPAAALRLVHLEQAFHFFEVYFHLKASTGFAYFLLERRIEEISTGRLFNPYTAARKAEERAAKRQSVWDGEEGVVWIFMDEVDYDLESRLLPPPAAEFVAELRQVEQFALEVEQKILQGVPEAVERVESLEFAYDLYKWWANSVNSPSFRLAHYRKLLDTLERGPYRFDLVSELLRQPYPPFES